MLVRLTGWITSRTIGRYAMASAASLAIDISIFLALLRIGAAPMVAGAVGYGLGIIAHWLLSTRFVFDDGMASDGPERLRQKMLFVVTAVIGLCLTTLIVGSSARMGIDPRLAKIVAVVVSFQTTYFARRATVFRA